uniref:Uncharacterized protein n=1 Tax=Chromera velia CCMP2878 TaxID=1169474 RepID=A0A0G4HSG2_9ALVE|eukprot:Cvel_8237.t1-p1 / transcript=Cvel_8237.t1 / gene=Cvel_8237 / organism=Chromera_velia_CCMP2878 / gene_product=hypothetical protein / transcript_product=hypothetical protein / location=Cvel_scaffold450:33456-35138(-) / protein_length=313 / sequence_SO=supercontig / SO=protein_coding / is_pseudo=false
MYAAQPPRRDYPAPALAPAAINYAPTQAYTFQQPMTARPVTSAAYSVYLPPMQAQAQPPTQPAPYPQQAPVKQQPTLTETLPAMPPPPSPGNYFPPPNPLSAPAPVAPSQFPSYPNPYYYPTDYPPPPNSYVGMGYAGAERERRPLPYRRGEGFFSPWERRRERAYRQMMLSRRPPPEYYSHYDHYRDDYYSPAYYYDDPDDYYYDDDEWNSPRLPPPPRSSRTPRRRSSATPTPAPHAVRSGPRYASPPRGGWQRYKERPQVDGRERDEEVGGEAGPAAAGCGGDPYQPFEGPKPFSMRLDLKEGFLNFNQG